jgi:hypothetical protein
VLLSKLVEFSCWAGSIYLASPCSYHLPSENYIDDLLSENGCLGGSENFGKAKERLGHPGKSFDPKRVDIL